MTSQLPPSMRRAVRHAAFSVALAIGAAGTLAGEGHDHGDATPAAATPGSPRLSAHSDLFELVGVVDRGVMTVYLDRYASNEPVIQARIEYESGTDKGVAQPQADGTYLIRFDALGKPGELPFSFTVSAGSDTDLLAGDLDIHDPHEHARAEPAARVPWLSAAVAVAVTAGLGITLFMARRYRGAFHRRQG